MTRKYFFVTILILFGIGHHFELTAQCDTLFIKSDTVVIFDAWNQHGSELEYGEYLKLTDSIMHKVELENILLDTNLLVIATKLYNTTTCLGREFHEAHLEYISFYWDYLLEPCHKILQCYISGSSRWCPEFDLYIFGNQFFHDNSRYKIICSNR